MWSHLVGGALQCCWAAIGCRWHGFTATGCCVSLFCHLCLHLGNHLLHLPQLKHKHLFWLPHQLINQSINAEFVGRRYTTRPGAPAASVKSTIKKYILESFSKCTGISNIMNVGRKNVPGGWTAVEKATFTKSCSCSWQNVGLWASGPQSVSAAGCRNRGNTVWKIFWC